MENESGCDEEEDNGKENNTSGPADGRKRLQLHRELTVTLRSSSGSTLFFPYSLAKLTKNYLNKFFYKETCITQLLIITRKLNLFHLFKL